MTNRKRPWWMLHWPSWLALVVFGGAFVVLNCVAFTTDARIGFPIHTLFIMQFDAGWPFTIQHTSDVASEGLPFALWIWETNDPPRFETDAAWNIKTAAQSWSWKALIANVAIGTALVLAAVFMVEQQCRRFFVKTTKALTLVLGVIGGIVAMLRFSPDNVRWAVSAATVFAIAIGLASLAVLDGIGWLFGRLAKREA